MDEKKKANFFIGFLLIYGVTALILIIILIAFVLSQKSTAPHLPTSTVPSEKAATPLPSPTIDTPVPHVLPPKSSEQTKTPVYSWQDAADHYGEYCMIEGQIVATHNSGKACFLNFHANWKKYFTAVIFASDFHKFPKNPEDYYRGKHVRVTGVVKEYQGKPEIILNSPSQIEIVK